MTDTTEEYDQQWRCIALTVTNGRCAKVAQEGSRFCVEPAHDEDSKTILDTDSYIRRSASVPVTGNIPDPESDDNDY